MIPYFVYARKSQDRTDRQIMSIEGQINEIKRFARERGYHIVDVLIETQSAKKPGRPIFNEMIERIQKGEAKGILCWKLNRLARNPIDAGSIAWLLQGNIIHAIHSAERSYLPTDNVLLMQIDFGIANQFIKDLSGDVKRGMRDKAKRGWNPNGSLPIGYMHHPDKQNAKEQVVCDKRRFPIVQELWKRMATGAYSVRDMERYALQMGLVSRKGKPYEKNRFYNMFRSPMYYGKFYWRDEADNLVLYPGKHQAMITESVFWKVQNILGQRSHKNYPQQHSYTFRGLITCGECNGHVTAERKLQVICSNCKHKYSIISNEVCRKCHTPLSKMENPTIIDHVYYHCTKNLNPQCSQGSINERVLEEQILTHLKNVTIPTEFHDYLTDRLEPYLNKKHENSTLVVESMKRKKFSLNEKIKKTLDLMISGSIDKSEADQLRDQYKRELVEIDQKLSESENAPEIELKENTEYLNFTKNCIEKYKTGDWKVKKETIAFLCSNLILLDKKLYFPTKKEPDALTYLLQSLLFHSAQSNLNSAQIS